MKSFLTAIVLFFCFHGFSQESGNPIIFKLMGHSDDLECMAISGNGRYLASGSWDGMVSLFTTDSQYTPSGTFIDHFSAVNAISFTTNGKFMVTAGNDGKVFTYTIDTFGYAVKDKSLALHRMSINAVYIDPGAKFIFTGSNDGTILQYELAKNKERKINNNNAVTSIAVGRDRRTVYCSDNTSIIKRYDMLNPNLPVINYEGHSDQVNCVALNRDNKWLVSGSSDKTIKIWNTLNGKLERTLEGHDWKVLTLAISNDSKYIVSGSNDGSVKLWDFETGKELKSFNDLGTNVRGVAFGNDNSIIYTVLNYKVDSFETKGILAIASGIEKPKKTPPKTPNKTRTPNVATPKPSEPEKTPDSSTTKEIIKKTEDIEISKEKKK